MQTAEHSRSSRLGIGVPVYNGARYIARTLDSLLAQTYSDFELTITDNASTDGTEAICREYAAKDRRVRYFRAEQNQGVVRNFNWCFELSCGEYFKWQAADDLCAPTLVEKCVAVLDADPTVVVAFAKSLIIDEEDKPKRVNDYDIDADDPRPQTRFATMINIDHRQHAAQEIYGVIRRSALVRTPLYEPCVRTDSILLARLAIIGRFRCVDEPLFLNREHEQRSVRLVPGERARVRSRLSRWVGVGPIPPPEFWDPSVRDKIVFPEWRILREYIRSPRFAELSAAERWACYARLIPFSIKHIPKLGRDLFIALEHLLLGKPGTAAANRFAPHEKAADL